MNMGLLRSAWTVPADFTTVVIATDADLTANAIRLENASFGTLYIPSTFDGTQIKFHVCATETGTFVPLADDGGTVITYTVAASTAVSLPPELFGARYCKIETVTDQATTDTVFIVTLKG